MPLTSSSTITGAEFRAFYLEHWPSRDWYLEDTGFDFEDENGSFILADDAVVKLGDCGYLAWQGPEGQPHKHGTMFPFLDFYRRYAETRTTETLVIEVPKDRVEAMTIAAISLGGTVRVGTSCDAISPIKHA